MIDLVVAACVTVLERERGEMDAALQALAPGWKLGQIMDYYDEALSLDGFPCFMVDPATENGLWKSMPVDAEEYYSLSIWCHVHHDDRAIRAYALRRLASIAKAAFNRRHLAHEIAPGVEIYYLDKLPVDSIVYGTTQFPSAFVGSVQITYGGHLRRTWADNRTPEEGIG